MEKKDNLYNAGHKANIEYIMVTWWFGLLLTLALLVFFFILRIMILPWYRRHIASLQLFFAGNTFLILLQPRTIFFPLWVDKRLCWKEGKLCGDAREALETFFALNCPITAFFAVLLIFGHLSKGDSSRGSHVISLMPRVFFSCLGSYGRKCIVFTQEKTHSTSRDPER